MNKFSGKGLARDFETRTIAACGAAGVTAAFSYTQHRGHATSLAKAAAAEGFSHVVAVGGDGTVNEVAQGLIGGPLTMGIVAKGSGNGLARHLKIPMDPNEAVKKLFQSAPVEIDSFTLNGKLSLNVSGIGFDGHVARLFATNPTRGLQGYARISLQEFFHFREFEAEIVTPQETLKRSAFIIAIANSSQYGNNARIAPTASVTDERLHVCLLKKVPPYRLDFLYAFFAGTMGETEFCEILEDRNFSIRLQTPHAYHIDGEPAGTTDRFDVVLQPHSLKVLVPPEATHY